MVKEGGHLPNSEVVLDSDFLPLLQSHLVLSIKVPQMSPSVLFTFASLSSLGYTHVQASTAASRISGLNRYGYLLPDASFKVDSVILQLQ